MQSVPAEWPKACLPMCPRLSISRKSPRVNELTGSKSTFKKDTKRQGIYPRANNFVENGNELSLKKQTKFSLKAFFLKKKKPKLATFSCEPSFLGTSTVSTSPLFFLLGIYLLLFSFIQYLKKKIVPTQPNNSSSI